MDVSKYKVGQTLVNTRSGKEFLITEVQLMTAPFIAEYTLKASRGRLYRKCEPDLDSRWTVKNE